eukprot:TRINITY_DN45736_c0_g2_i1.p1 TRINITY_DN45736_c0_g2~~TRINITY_DN45736_c0_g2_i1.p1  ORF type:complete len:247 (+),score=11.45 TRINITY_DN45736_c0_g2_i1:129-869(+)
MLTETSSRLGDSEGEQTPDSLVVSLTCPLEAAVLQVSGAAAAGCAGPGASDRPAVVTDDRNVEAVLKAIVGTYTWTGGRSLGRRVYAKAINRPRRRACSTRADIDPLLSSDVTAALYYWPWQDDATGELREGWHLGPFPPGHSCVWARCKWDGNAPRIARDPYTTRHRSKASTISCPQKLGCAMAPPETGWDLPIAVSSGPNDGTDAASQGGTWRSISRRMCSVLSNRSVAGSNAPEDRRHLPTST